MSTTTDIAAPFCFPATTVPEKMFNTNYLHESGAPCLWT